MIKLKYICMDTKDQSVNSERAVKFSVSYCFVCIKDILLIHKQNYNVTQIEDSWKNKEYRNYCNKHKFETYNITLRNALNSQAIIYNVILNKHELNDLLDDIDYENR